MPEADCNEAIHALYRFLDGELTDEVRVKIKRHLEDCPPCFEAFDFEAELRIVIAQKCREQVPLSLLQRVAEAINYEARQTFCSPGRPDLGYPGSSPEPFRLRE